MRQTLTLFIAMAIVLPATACSSGRSAPSRTNAIASYGPGSQGSIAQSTRPATFQWYTRLADAQSAARTQGKMILATSTRPGCGLCEKFRHKVVPQVASQTAAIAVGYVYDIGRPEVPAIDRTLRDNLKGATLMPLVGFLTTDLGWVHGFWGGTDAQKFLGDIAVAQRIHPVTTASVSHDRLYDGAVMAAVTNEFGETEWGIPGDIWPEGKPNEGEFETFESGAPIPGCCGTDDVRLADAGPAAHTAPDPLAVGGPAPTPASLATNRPVAPPAPAALPPVERVTAPAAVPAAVPAAAPTSIPAAAVVADVPAAPKAPSGWAERQLQVALDQIESGEYDRARATLREVTARADGDVAREAARGSVAIYNHKRIQGASGAERDRYVERARRDLGASMWADLFS